MSQINNKELADISRCANCGGEMRPNIPRMGWDGGAVHIANNGFNCPSDKSLNWIVRDLTNSLPDQFFKTKELAEKWVARLWEWQPNSRPVIIPPIKND